MRVANLDQWNNSYHEDSLVIENMLTGEECSQVQSISRALMTRADATVRGAFPALLCKSRCR